MMFNKAPCRYSYRTSAKLLMTEPQSCLVKTQLALPSHHTTKAACDIAEMKSVETEKVHLE